jgi:phosphoribosyl 1,2-cyclic phosphodiesterase
VVLATAFFRKRRLRDTIKDIGHLSEKEVLVEVTFWGTRGSIPRTMPDSEFLGLLVAATNQAKSLGILTLDEFAKAAQDGRLGRPLSYGGATMCTEVRAGEHSVFVDMGSGIRDAGTQAMQRGQKEFHILLTHMHWDHLIGFPFFLPLHSKNCTIHIHHVHKNAPEFVKIKFNGVNFPLIWDQLQAKVEFHHHKVYEPFKVGALQIASFALDHPGGCFGYRVDHKGQAVSVAVDGEFKRRTPKELGKDLKFLQNLDLMVFDSQYDRVELENRFDWGHCTPVIGVELALRERIKSVAFVHHDPWSTPHKLQSMAKEAADFLAANARNYGDVWKDIPSGGPKLIMGYDGLVLDLDKL